MLIFTSMKSIIFCTGKIYYELEEERARENISDIAIVRIEQLAPFPIKQFEALLKKYPKAEKYWTYILRVLPGHQFELISRKASASPATGYSKVHKEDQANIIKKALTL